MAVANDRAGGRVARARQDAAFLAWIALTRAHASAARVLSGELLGRHGLTIADYEALLHLATAEGGRLRRVDLAARLQLTPSGVTRLLQGLEEAGLVTRGTCPEDARVTYAVLTEAGRRRLDEASDSHLATVRSLFEGRYSDEELAALRGLLERLDADDGLGLALAAG